ncbi:hypothetical protein D3C73_1233120 [compost metagenome]
MDHDVRIIQENPTAFRAALAAYRTKVLLHQLFLDTVNDGVYLTLGRSGGNQEDVSERQTLADVQGDNVFSKLVCRGTRSVTGEGDGLFMCRHGYSLLWPVAYVWRLPLFSEN